ncbi:glycoside hydrolase family protein [uncultured Bacteroides sp.]|uniref:glycoside hydrolase family protein n=1 Tax=uncultured Bacteroides sp. TaxID=162156 RepID=UPI00280B93E7|nr:glycoside hydrolase family protein [uncultured Bacteroides sp.]
MRRKLLLLIGLCGFFAGMDAQITERKRPEEWQYLIEGGRFMDRFLPMQGSVTAKDVWGTDSVRLRYVDNGIELPATSFWGGNILQTPDGNYHLFVCGWPENSPKGHMFWPHSTVYHATSKYLHGPFVIKGSIGKGHNPEAFVLKDGRIVVYVIDGYYIADSMDGPWTYGKFDFDARDRKIIEGLSNLTFARRQDNSYLMVCRGGGVWVSRDGLSTYNQLTDKRVYPDVDGRFEDPVVWRDSLQYHLIVNDWLGRIAYYQRSKDGVHWVTEQGEAYMPGVSFHKDGYVEHWFKYERPKVFQDKQGRAVQMNFAVIDTIKWNDLPSDHHSSKNICIPLNKGLLLSVLNQEPIKPDTRTIEVKIEAEDDFDPQTEVDIESLRFGSYTEVNFGRGCKPLRTKKSGKDLIVVFNGKNSGITEEEFAPKMIGKDKKGNLIYGYARLPFVCYTPPLLSARRPVMDDAKKELTVEVQNFGLSVSQRTGVKVLCDGKIQAQGTVGPLNPYEQVVLSLKIENKAISEQPSYEVVFFRL